MADSSWTAEVRIPFSQLRYNQENKDGIWGLHIRRIIRRNNEVQNWSLIPIKNIGHVFSFGEMHGMEDLPKQGGIEILHHVLGKFTSMTQISDASSRQQTLYTLDYLVDSVYIQQHTSVLLTYSCQ